LFQVLLAITDSRARGLPNGGHILQTFGHEFIVKGKANNIVDLDADRAPWIAEKATEVRIDAVQVRVNVYEMDWADVQYAPEQFDHITSAPAEWARYAGHVEHDA
jgi:hypothetical protein